MYDNSLYVLKVQTTGTNTQVVTVLKEISNLFTSCRDVVFALHIGASTGKEQTVCSNNL